MTMYDGADNLSTTPCTLPANSNTTPSPQICSSTSDSTIYNPAYKAFDQVYTTGWESGYPPAAFTGAAIMVDRGAGNGVLVNKYKLLSASPFNSYEDANAWQLQGSNDASAVVSDAIDSAKWTVLDSQSSGLSLLGTFITFIEDTTYEKFRVYVTATRLLPVNGFPFATGELILVSQAMPPIEAAVSEASESTDEVSGYVSIVVDVSESSASTDQVDGTKDFEIVDISELSTSTDQVDIYQDVTICDVIEFSASTDSATSTVGIDDDALESSESTDAVECLDTFIVPMVDESSSSTDDVDCLKWTGAIIEVSDSIYIWDTVIADTSVLVQEALGLSDSTAAMLSLLVSEYLAILDAQTVKWNGTRTITDTFFIYEDIKFQFIQTINEALSLTDSPSAMLELLLSEFIAFTETTLPNWNTTRTVNDSLTLTDILYQQLNLILTEALTCTDSAPLCQLGLAIYEYLGFTEMLSSPGRFSVDTTDTLEAADSLNFGYAQVISDVFSLVDAADTIRLLLNTIAENLGLSESISASLNSVLPVAESLILIDTVTSQGRLYNIVHDTLLLNVVVELDGEVWECYVLNTPKFLPSIYSGFNFNSYCVFQNRAYGCKADGIYELTGDTDNGTVINTGVQLSETKFGLPNQKRFRKAYIGVSGTTPLLSMETETGETKTYSIDTDGEVDASRSLRSKKWKLTVTDFESLDFIKLVPVVLAK